MYSREVPWEHRMAGLAQRPDPGKGEKSQLGGAVHPRTGTGCARGEVHGDFGLGRNTAAELCSAGECLILCILDFGYFHITFTAKIQQILLAECMMVCIVGRKRSKRGRNHCRTPRFQLKRGELPGDFGWLWQKGEIVKAGGLPFRVS